MARSGRAPAGSADGHARAAAATLETATVTVEATAAAVEAAPAAVKAKLEQAAPAAMEADLEQAAPATLATVPEPAGPVGLAGTSAAPRPVLGLVLILNGHEVTLDAAKIADWRTNGFDQKIDKPISLGTYEDMAKSINQAFKVNLPVDASKFQPPFNEIAQNVSVTIQDAHINIPGSKAPNAPITYTLVVNVGIKEGAAIEGYGLKGFSFGVTNEATGNDTGAAAPKPANTLEESNSDAS